MTSLTESLREEHRELLPHIEGLRETGDSVGEASPESLRRGVDEAHEFLAHHLIPHAQAEERALYPAVAKAMGAAEATATMSRDHVEVSRLTEELGALRSGLSGDTLPTAQARELRRVLYGLYALVKAHFAKEEEIYLPILEARLTVEEARRVAKAMGEAAADARGHTP
jgi:iron-sulfur cluster repair protein YtfE (RIC family)